MLPAFHARSKQLIPTKQSTITYIDSLFIFVNHDKIITYFYCKLVGICKNPQMF